MLRLLLGSVLALWPFAANAADHPLHGVALVIGESKYQQLPVLTNPNKDARDIDRLLGDLGFDVDRVLNADGDELRDAIKRFTDEAKDADVALVYYSGHGIEAKGENFIAPIDTDASTPEKAGASMIPVQPLLEALSKAAPISIILLDACRSDPFPPGQMILLPGESAPAPVASEGLAAVRGPTPVARPQSNPDSLGAVIGFAAEPGEPALDGAPGENSPYAAALLKQLSAGGYSFGDVMTFVTEEVYLETDAKQLPWTNSSLRTKLTFDAPAENNDDPDHAAIRTERRKLLLSIASTPPETQRYVESLAGDEKVPLASLYGMLDALGIKPSDDNGKLEDQLQKGAARLKELLADRPQAVKSDAELERLSKLADDAESEGAIALALKYRDQASGRADTLLQGKQAEAEQLRQDMVDIADTYAANATTALLNFDHQHAADLFGKAFDAAKDWDKVKAIGFKISQGDALTDRGYYTTDNDALNSALAVYAEALALAPKDSDPFNWAKIENRIGQTQQTLGNRLTDPAMLQQAVVSFNAALTVQTQNAVPEQWASAQNNLANVLYTIGGRTNDQAVLQQAIDAFDKALTVYTADATPVDWATVESNRANARMALADAIYGATDDIQVKALQNGAQNADDLPEVKAALAQSIGILSDTVGSLQAALGVRPRSDNPLDWALIEGTLASIYADRGKLAESPADLEAAINAYRAVLTVHDKERTPVQWAISASNLAGTLRVYGGQTKSAAPLAEAADLLQQGIALTPRQSSPLDWALYQTKLGQVLADLAATDGKPATVDAAVAAYQSAAEVDTPEVDPDKWSSLQLYMIDVLLKESVPKLDRVRLQQAYDIGTAAQSQLHDLHSPLSASFDGMLPTLQQLLAAMPK